MSRNQFIKIIRIILAVVILLTAKNNLFFLLSYLIVGIDVLYYAIKELFKNHEISEYFLMSVATIGAFFIGEFHEASFVMLFYQIGEFFGDFAYDKSEQNIKKLLDLRPDYANLVKGNNVEKVDPKVVNIGDIILIKPYEKVPIDGCVIEGETNLDTKSLTGESIPRYVTISDTVLSGTVNYEGTIKIKATKLFKDSSASKIIDLLEKSSEKKSKPENFITVFAKIYTPIVCILSLLIFIIPVSINIFFIHRDPAFNIWGYRALVLLVISCPCALVVSVPLAFFASIGNASKKRILIKGSNYIESLSKVKTVAFDKTGTMTKGIFEVIDIHHTDDKNKILEIAAHLEFFSNHPIANCIKKEYGKNIDKKRINDVKEIGGYGLSGYVDGKKVLVGSNKLMKNNNIDYEECSSIGTIVHVAYDNQYMGHIVISDVIKPDSKKAVEMLKKININNIMMLTGDLKNVAFDVANIIGIKNVYYELLPQDKLRIVEEEISKKKNNEKIAFVGDGINDAPCLVRSDIGISMGSIGSDAAVEASDVVLMDESPLKIYELICIAKRTMAVVYINIIVSIFVKLLVLILSAVGISNMGLAVFADVGVLILCVINSVLLLFY